MQVKTHMKMTAIAAAMCIALPSTSSAQTVAEPTEAQLLLAQLIEDAGGKERINFSGKLRMLSQRIPAAACNLHAGIAPEISQKILFGASAEFNQIVQALELGDGSIGIIGEEKRRKTLAALDKVKASWQPMNDAASMILDAGTSPDTVQELADNNNEVLKIANLLVSELTGQYSDPASLVQADAIRIDIAGRQRMLSQRMSKDACMVLSGINVEASNESLGKAISTFAISLTALSEGMPAAGIKASTNPEIIAGLELVTSHWAALKPTLDALNTGAQWDADKRAEVFTALNTLLVDMNKVVQMYASKPNQQT